MADHSQKWPENVPGRFYVDETCICSNFCTDTAPENFRMDEAGHAYVFQQPVTPEQEVQCKEALAGCPVSAIGEDGDKND